MLSFRSRAGNKPYTWNVVPEHTALGVCLERMHRGFSELMTLAQRYNPVDAGPRRVSTKNSINSAKQLPSDDVALCTLWGMFRFLLGVSDHFTSE